MREIFMWKCLSNDFFFKMRFLSYALRRVVNNLKEMERFKICPFNITLFPKAMLLADGEDLG